MSDGSRQKDGATGWNTRHVPSILELEASGHANQNLRGPPRARRPLTGGANFFQREMGAFHEPMGAWIARPSTLDGSYRCEGSHGREACFHMECPWTAIATEPIPVMKAIGHVARLLNLSHQVAGSKRMHGSGGKVVAVACA